MTGYGVRAGNGSDFGMQPVEDYRPPPRMGRAKAARSRTDSDDTRRTARLRKGGRGPTSLLPAFRREPMPLPTRWIRIAPRRSDSWSVGAQVVGGDGRRGRRRRRLRDRRTKATLVERALLHHRSLHATTAAGAGGARSGSGITRLITA